MQVNHKIGLTKEEVGKTQVSHYH